MMNGEARAKAKGVGGTFTSRIRSRFLPDFIVSRLSSHKASDTLASDGSTIRFGKSSCSLDSVSVSAR